MKAELKHCSRAPTECPRCVDLRSRAVAGAAAIFDLAAPCTAEAAAEATGLSLCGATKPCRDAGKRRTALHVIAWRLACGERVTLLCHCAPRHCHLDAFVPQLLGLAAMFAARAVGHAPPPLPPADAVAALEAELALAVIAPPPAPAPPPPSPPLQLLPPPPPQPQQTTTTQRPRLLHLYSGPCRPGDIRACCEHLGWECDDIDRLRDQSHDLVSGRELCARACSETPSQGAGKLQSLGTPARVSAAFATAPARWRSAHSFARRSIRGVSLSSQAERGAISTTTTRCSASCSLCAGRWMRRRFRSSSRTLTPPTGSTTTRAISTCLTIRQCAT